MLVTETQISWSFFIIIFVEFQNKTSRQGTLFGHFFLRVLKYLNLKFQSKKYINLGCNVQNYVVQSLKPLKSLNKPPVKTHKFSFVKQNAE